MLIVQPSVQLINALSRKDLYTQIELAGRVCYKSEDKITDDSAEGFIRRVLNRGHEAVIEHASISLKVVCDRGVTHEIVRHRIASYCQESTRYCNYSQDKFGQQISVIEPLYLDKSSIAYKIWCCACANAENAYFSMLSSGCSPQEARAVLPNSLKTEIVITMNPREWRHFFTLRCAPAAHPQMRQVALMALEVMHTMYPVLFEDIAEKFLGEGGTHV